MESKGREAKLRMSWFCALAVTFFVDGAFAASDNDWTFATGLVFHDVNGNAKRDKGEPGLPGIRVSNGRDVVETDAKGHYRISVDVDTVLFILKPSNWTSPLNAYNLPLYYHTHRPLGSPQHLKYAGVPATGPLPTSVDFPLIKQKEARRFHVLVLADPQIGNLRQLELFQSDVLPELISSDAAFGVTLGDIAWNDLSWFEAVNRAISHVGIPWYNVVGNHDINFDHTKPETFIRHYGPPWYAFDYGMVHFIVLQNARSRGDETDRRFLNDFGPDQLEFVRNDLRGVPKERLVVLLAHASLSSTLRSNASEVRTLFSLLKGRRHVLAISGHHHRNLYHWFGAAEHWPNEEPLYERVVGAVSGNWWRGALDEWGIPMSMMRDGTPQGYFVFSFDENRWSYRFKATRRPAEYQMHIYLPSTIRADEIDQSQVLVNVYAGNDRSRTEMRVDKGKWTRMKRVDRADPYYERLYDLQTRFKREYKRLPGAEIRGKPARVTHLWQAPLPDDLTPGSHLVEVRSTDMFDQTWTSHRVFSVTAN